MGPGRLIYAVAFFLSLFAMLPEAYAAWWFGEESQWEKSGLDLEQGYDRNTVVTQSGKVINIDAEGGSGPALAVVQAGDETVTLVLGPKEFWHTGGFALKPGDTVVAKGSKAVGKDGKSYLIVQSISTPATGKELTLRNESGRPAWSGGNRPQQQQRHPPTRQFRGGRPNR